MQAAPTGPTLLGVDVIWVATLLSAVATMAVMVALYAATTVKDPMARRVKALNERREQLKAGIVASTNKRKKLTMRDMMNAPRLIHTIPPRPATISRSSAKNPLMYFGLMNHTSVKTTNGSEPTM